MNSRLIYNKEFSNNISSLCIEKYNQLPKTGKPNVEESQWTLLSGICLEKDCDLSVVALATGTKCLGSKSYSRKGDVLHDSHAEVLTRRAWLRYLYCQMKVINEGSLSEIFEKDPLNKFVLKPNIRFHFFTSHIPCGDASIFARKIKKKTLEKIQNQAKRMKLEKDFLKKKKNKLLEGDTSLGMDDSSSESDDSLSGGDSGNLVDDVHRTGAKCLSIDSKQDLKSSTTEFHVLGVVRTKPGRGDPTLSMSCSDKIAKWNVVGWQGGLLSLLLKEPIHMKTITVGGGISFSMEALERALITRVSSIIRTPPILFHSESVFPFGKRQVKKELKKIGKPLSSLVPVASSVIWSHVSYKPLEVSIGGVRQGTARKKHDQDNTKSTLLVSTSKLFLQFIQVTGDTQLLNQTIDNIKQTNKKYQDELKKFKEVMGKWIDIPKEFRQFSVQNVNHTL